MKLSVVIPMYNEARICEKTAQELTALCRTLPYDDYEILFSDDGSADDSRDRVAALAARDAHLRLLCAPDNRNRGKGGAVRAGICASTGDTVLFTDCDLAYGTDQLAGILRAHAESGCGVTVGSRALHPDGYAGYSIQRRIASRLYLRLVCLLAGFSISDSQTGLKCFAGPLAREVFAACETDGFAFDLEALLLARHAGAQICEFPVCVRRSDAALGRVSRVHMGRDAWQMLGDVRRIRRRIRKQS